MTAQMKASLGRKPAETKRQIAPWQERGENQANKRSEDKLASFGALNNGHFEDRFRSLFCSSFLIAVLVYRINQCASHYLLG